jgi:lipoate-protein ligase A
MTRPGPEIHDSLLESARAAGAARARVWEPRQPAVVLGRSNDAERECDLDACRALEVPVVGRLGGGGTVLLLPGMVVVTLAGPSGASLDARALFGRINAHLASVLAGLGVEGLQPAGISDLCLQDRKVLGCSLAFRRGWALYQGALLVDCDLEPISRCLRHPSREPAYRAGRPHAEFLTTLARCGFALPVERVRAALAASLAPETVAALTAGTTLEARCA